jgi:hypothetical protein
MLPHTETEIQGNSAFDAILELFDTEDYYNGNEGNNIDWIPTMELFLTGMLEYEASYYCMLITAQTEQLIGQSKVDGLLAIQQYGYDGRPGAIAYLLLLQGFLLSCAIAAIIAGRKTGVKRVPAFDLINTTTLIAASAAGGRHGHLPGLAGRRVSAGDHALLNTRIRLHE